MHDHNKTSIVLAIHNTLFCVFVIDMYRISGRPSVQSVEDSESLFGIEITLVVGAVVDGLSSVLL